MSESTDESPAPSVLIVDDTPGNLLALQAVLEPVGVRIVEARSGEEAIAHAAKEQFALILMDVQMPGLDGFDTARILRRSESSRETPIIFLTAIHRDEQYARVGYEIGGADYLLKPFNPEVLRARVRSFADLFNQREQLRRSQVRTRTRERDEALRQLVAFERIATAALESADLDMFLATLLSVFQDALGSVDAAGILLREGDRLEARASFGLDEGVATRFSERVGEGFAGTIAATREPLHLADASASRLVRSPWVESRGIRGLFGVPLIVEGDLFGVAYIGSARESDFSASERRLFTAVAERAASAVDRVRSRRRVEQLLEAEKVARREAEEAERRQRFLAEVSRVLVSSLDVDATVETVVRMAVPDFADWCAVDLVDEAGEITRRAVAYADQSNDFLWARFAECSGDFFDVPRIVQTRASTHASRDATGSSAILPSEADAVARELDLRSWMGAPLLRPKGALGALLLGSTRKGRSYSEANLAFSEEVAVRIAMAVENAELYRRAQAAIRIREDFVSIASHELKTPLTPLKLQLASLQRRLPEDRATVLSRLAVADRQVDKMNELVSQLLDVSKIAAGRLELLPQWIDLRSIVERVIERFSVTASKSQLQLAGESPAAFLDPFRVEQLVSNLIGNAVKYGQGKPIQVELSSVDERARLVVRDQGIGIGALEQRRIFERFERAVSTGQYGGFGLGLWIARQVVEASGGKISVKSALGEGAEFTVLLPRGATRAEENPARAREAMQQ